MENGISLFFTGKIGFGSLGLGITNTKIVNEMDLGKKK